MKIVIGQGSCGIAAGAEKVRRALLNTDINAESVTITGCIGMCWLEPIVDIYDDNNGLTRLVKVSETDAQAIADFVNSGDRSAVEKLIVSDEDNEFLTKQTRIALRNCGIIDPEKITEYREHDGYTALKKALGMTPEDVIEIIKTSGLAGRGGAGFPTWFKWNAARQSEGEEKYLICNADEGDPGAFMDYAHRRLRHRRQACGRLCPRRISACHQAPEKRHRAGCGSRHHRRKHLRQRLFLRLYDQGRRRRVCLRRGDRADRIARGSQRYAAFEAAVPGAIGLLEKAV